MEDSNATDDWLDQHPYIDFSKTDSDDGVVSVRVPIDTLPAHTGRKNSRSNVHVQQDTGTEVLAVCTTSWSQTHGDVSFDVRRYRNMHQ